MYITGHTMEINNKQRRVLNVFILAMINVSMMLSLRSLPMISEFGLSSLFYFFIVAIFFLSPARWSQPNWPQGGQKLAVSTYG
jgi:hypothetical protein